MTVSFFQVQAENLHFSNFTVFGLHSIHLRDSSLFDYCLIRIDFDACSRFLRYFIGELPKKHRRSIEETVVNNRRIFELNKN